jgi:hypothetical protein
LAILPAESSSSKTGGTGKGMMNFTLQSVSFILQKVLYHDTKSYMGITALLPLWRKECCEFLLPLEPANLGFNGKHAYHYTTEDGIQIHSLTPSI